MPIIHGITYDFEKLTERKSVTCDDDIEILIMKTELDPLQIDNDHAQIIIISLVHSTGIKS